MRSTAGTCLVFSNLAHSRYGPSRSESRVGPQLRMRTSEDTPGPTEVRRYRLTWKSRGLCFIYSICIYIYIIYCLSPCVALLQVPSCSSKTNNVGYCHYCCRPTCAWMENVLIATIENIVFLICMERVNQRGLGWIRSATAPLLTVPTENPVSA